MYCCLQFHDAPKIMVQRISTSCYFINFHPVISIKIKNYFFKSTYTFSIIAKTNYLNPVILIGLLAAAKGKKLILHCHSTFLARFKHFISL